MASVWVLFLLLEHNSSALDFSPVFENWTSVNKASVSLLGLDFLETRPVGAN